MNIIGYGSIISERVKKEYKTKNRTTQIIERIERKALLLGCGHKVPLTDFNVEPTTRTTCKICER